MCCLVKQVKTVGRNCKIVVLPAVSRNELFYVLLVSFLCSQFTAIVVWEQGS